MPHVSRHKLPNTVEKNLIESIQHVLSKITNKEEMVVFLDALLTPTEKLMLAKRLAIVVLLKEGLSDSQIADILHVTRITVSKIELFYEARGKGFDIGLKILNNQKLTKSIKKLLLSLARYSARAAGGYVKPGILD